MNIAVFGTGGVGGYFGGRLAEAGHQVTFIARGAHLEAIRTSGLRVESVAGDFTIAPANATDDPATVDPVDAVLLGVKAWQIEEAAEAIRPLVGKETCVVPLQNGVEATDILSRVLGSQCVVGGLCAIVSMVSAPGCIRHAGVDPVVRFGELDNRRSTRITQLLEAFESAGGLKADIPDDITAAIWKKFVFISSWSSVASVSRVPVGILRTTWESRQLLEQVLDEVLAVGRARGVDLPDGVRRDTLAFVDSLAPESTASMQRDVMAGRPSELESQTGAIVRLGTAAGVAVPATEVLYRALLPGELLARGQA